MSLGRVGRVIHHSSFIIQNACHMVFEYESVKNGIFSVGFFTTNFPLIFESKQYRFVFLLKKSLRLLA